MAVDGEDDAKNIKTAEEVAAEATNALALRLQEQVWPLTTHQGCKAWFALRHFLITSTTVESLYRHSIRLDHYNEGLCAQVGVSTSVEEEKPVLTVDEVRWRPRLHAPLQR